MSSRYCGITEKNLSLLKNIWELLLDQLKLDMNVGPCKLKIIRIQRNSVTQCDWIILRASFTW